LGPNGILSKQIPGGIQKNHGNLIQDSRCLRGRAEHFPDIDLEDYYQAAFAVMNLHTSFALLNLLKQILQQEY
jgi:hypothetical protein